MPIRVGVLLALLPLVFTGKAMLLGRLYGPADLYATAEPWKRTTAEGVAASPNPILSDLAFANLPWRAAVREALVNGRAPLWNRFVLGGNPLLGAAQAGVFHPSTWLGIWLPLSLSWTFSCSFTLFLAVLAGFLFFRDFGLGVHAALVGAVGWGFSTYVVFWDGWSVGPSTATFPLLLLGLRRLARAPAGGGVGLTAFALCLSLFGGHPESFFHCVAAGGVYFAWELAAAGRRAAARAIGSALVAGGLAVLLTGPQLFPLLEVIPRSAEYRVRRAALSAGTARQSVPVAAAAARLLPDVLPFAHGIYGKSAVDAQRRDGSGMPLGYAGAVLFPLAALAFVGRPRVRGRAIFLTFFLVGVAYGASAPVLLDLTARLPGFALALNYRLVFLSGLGLAGLAALGAQSIFEAAGPRRLAVGSAAVAGALLVAFAAARPVFAARGLEAGFLRRGLLFEIVPVILLLLAAVGARRRPGAVVDAAIVWLALQRFLEMGGTYPTLPPGAFPPRLPTLAALPLGSDPSRITALADGFRPNASALYGIEDVRGYESLVLDRFADTFPLWSRAQTASFNRVDDLARPFLSFLNVRYAIGAPDAAAPAGWLEQARGPELAIFTNSGALPRAFVPRRLAQAPDPVAAMASVADFAETAFVAGAGGPDAENGAATLVVREVGPDLVVAASATSCALVATSLPAWPGWTVEADGRPVTVETVNHAFVGFRVETGEHVVRLRYRPQSWTLGIAAFFVGLAAAAALGASSLRSRRPPAPTPAGRDS
ncbi:MAG TPA: YfhO family protein [Thermoanaerobaculia bacterium]|nr:YfhO family protein [Thermoanaerobaculia bacterium]